MISMNLRELSKREQILLGIFFVVLIAAGVSLYLQRGTAKPTKAALTPPVVQAPKVSNVQQSQPNNIQTPLVNIKDPFQVPASYQPKTEVKSSPSIPAPQTAAQPVQSPPKLSGIVSSKGTKKAILEYAGSSETVGVGDNVGPYKIESITDTQVALSGKERLTLTVGR